MSVPVNSQCLLLTYHLLIFKFWRVKHGQAPTTSSIAGASLEPMQASNPSECWRSHLLIILKRFQIRNCRIEVLLGRLLAVCRIRGSLYEQGNMLFTQCHASRQSEEDTESIDNSISPTFWLHCRCKSHFCGGDGDQLQMCSVGGGSRQWSETPRRSSGHMAGFNNWTSSICRAFVYLVPMRKVFSLHFVGVLCEECSILLVVILND